MRGVKLLVPLLLLAGGIFAYLLFTGPRMREQPKLKAHDARMPRLASGSVPVEPAPFAMGEPLQGTPEERQRGRVYYGYYCRFCHGDLGDGNGPVGESYVPRPTDLRQASVQTRSDRELLLASLVGVGHEPVLERVVPAAHRWFLIAYLKSLGPP